MCSELTLTLPHYSLHGALAGDNAPSSSLYAALAGYVALLNTQTDLKTHTRPLPRVRGISLFPVRVGVLGA
jgi:hypothetical protein